MCLLFLCSSLNIHLRQEDVVGGPLVRTSRAVCLLIFKQAYFIIGYRGSLRPTQLQMSTLQYLELQEINHTPKNLLFSLKVSLR